MSQDQTGTTELKKTCYIVDDVQVIMDVILSVLHKLYQEKEHYLPFLSLNNRPPRLMLWSHFTSAHLEEWGSDSVEG